MKALFNGVPKKRVIVDFLLCIVFSLVNCAWTSYVTTVVTRTFDNSIIAFILSLILFAVSWELFELVCDIHAEISCMTIYNEVSRYYLLKLYNITPDVLKKNNTGYVSGVLQQLIERQSTAYSSVVMEAPISFAYMVYFSIRLGHSNPKYGLLLMGCYLLSNLYRTLVNKFLVMPKTEAVVDAQGLRNKMVIDFISNMNTVQKMSAVDYADHKIKLANGECIHTDKIWVLADEIAYTVPKCIMWSFFPMCLWIMYTSGDVVSWNNTVFLALLAAVATQATHNSKALFRAIKYYGKFKAALSKLNFVEDYDNQRYEKYSGDFNNVTIEDCCYSYNEKVEEQERTVTIDIPMFHVNRGEFVCITGESGQGKTTLLDILSGQIETECVKVNNEWLDDKRLDCVFISQDTEIFDMTLRDNLTLGKQIPSSVLIHHLEAVGLGDWLRAQPAGLDTVLGERGVFVSTGQRQRINLVRGLLIKDKEIYLLDEPTSNVDDETEAKMIELIKNSLYGRTVIIVSHKPKITEICQVHYEFVNGRLRLCE